MKQSVIKIADLLKGHKGTILISGATGLIGSVLVDVIMTCNTECHAQFNVIAVARNEICAKSRFEKYFGRDDFKFIAHDVNEPFSEVDKVDYIIHAASNTHPMAYSSDPIGTIKANVIGTDNLLQLAVKNPGTRFVFLSSVEVYGECPETQEAFKETDFGYLDCNQVRAGYPESKRVGEALCRAYESQYGVDVVIARLCRVYGSTMRWDDSKALAQFVKKAVNGEDIILKSEGQQYYSYIHVFDAVSAIFHIMTYGKSGEAYNVSSALSNVKLIDLAEKLASIAGTKVVFELPDELERSGYSKATRAILDNSKLKALGWSEIYDIDSGLKSTVELLKKCGKNEDDKNIDTVGCGTTQEASDD